MTEEMEEKKSTSTYEDYKFVTKTDLENMNASHLIGTNALLPYMHGFYMQNKLAEIHTPLTQESHRKKRLREELDKMRDKRIVHQTALPKVNTQFAREVLQMDRKDQKEKDKQKQEGLASILTDDRFKAMFEDKDYKIDKDDAALTGSGPKSSIINKLLEGPTQEEDNESQEEEEVDGEIGNEVHAEKNDNAAKRQAIKTESAALLDMLTQEGSTTMNMDKSKTLQSRLKNK